MLASKSEPPDFLVNVLSNDVSLFSHEIQTAMMAFPQNKRKNSTSTSQMRSSQRGACCMKDRVVSTRSVVGDYQSSNQSVCMQR